MRLSLGWRNLCAVEGVLLIGSTNTSALTPASDYDMIVVLNEMPAPIHVRADLH